MGIKARKPNFSVYKFLKKKTDMARLLVLNFILFFVFHFTHGGTNKRLIQLGKRFSKQIHVEDSDKEETDELCPNFDKNFDNAWILAEECIKNIDNNLTMCEQVKKYTPNCTQPLVEAIQECIPVLPGLAVKSFMSVVDHFCKETGENLLELSNPCFWKTFLEDDEKLKKCERTIYNELENIIEDSPSQSQLCSVLTNSQSCLHEITDSCKSVKTRNAFMGLYEAFMAPCSNV
ncbi:uncharacterized protein LOC123015560 [Tribolium madens]|uniref:uncharacterized protein LOC123015560 n=1 Tax=Tribolium madens TaxID=41895 RepID=UPI001CF727D7|nr:uncharacterized protein LOC123015560 [Tribolium madens]